MHVLCNFKATWHQGAYFSVSWIHHRSTSCLCLYFTFLGKVLPSPFHWQEKFDEFCPEHLEVSKNFILMCSFWAKYILFELKMYRGVIFHEPKEGCKIWRGINSLFKNWHKEFDKFWPERSKVSKIFTLMGSLWARYILFELKRREE